MHEDRKDDCEEFFFDEDIVFADHFFEKRKFEVCLEKERIVKRTFLHFMQIIVTFQVDLINDLQIVRFI